MKVRRILLGILCCLLAFFAAYFNVFGAVDKAAEDILYHRPKETDSKIKIIKIDDYTMNQMGDFSTWSRDVYADLIDVLCVSEDLRPAVIGFDILFSSDKSVAGDMRFAETCAKVKNVITGFSYTFSDSEKVLPYDALLRSTGHGFVNSFVNEDDGIVRSSLLDSDEADGIRRMSFGSAVYAKYMEVTGGQAVYYTDGNEMEFKYTGATGDYESFSMADVLQGKVQAEEFDDCIVLVGVCAPGVSDEYFVPVDRPAQMYGVEIHANVIQALLENKTLMELPAILDGLIALIIVLVLLLLCENLSTVSVIIMSSVAIVVKLLVGLLIFNIGFSSDVLVTPFMSFVIGGCYIVSNCYRKNNNKKIVIALTAVAVLLSVVAVFSIKAVVDNNEYQNGSIVDDSGEAGVAHVHNVEKITVEATCSDAGLITQSCCECNEIISITEVQALGHDYAEEFTVDKEVTCTTEGSKSKHCKRCDSKGEVTVIAVTGHEYSEWKEVLAADCVKAGKRERSCEVCGHTEEGTIKALGHYFSGKYIVETPATCTTSGVEWNYCSRCNAKGEKRIIEPVGHDYTEWEITAVAECEHTGEKERGCKNCGYTEKEVIEALGHYFSDIYVVETPATCMTSGVEWNYCTRCNAKGEKRIIELGRHDYTKWETIVIPDCEHAGEKKHSCKDCGYTEREVVEALGHEFSDKFTIDIPPTCEEQGIKSKYCLYCNARSEITVVEATGHSYDNGGTDVSEPGYSIYCTVCKKILEED